MGLSLGLQTLWPCFTSQMAVFGQEMVIFSHLAVAAWVHKTFQSFH